MIRFLRNRDIDREKWDACVKESRNGLCYGYSWFLDVVSEGWEGLVEDDYVSVMPLPIRYKLGVGMVMQPMFTQQLGVFSLRDLKEEDIVAFLGRIPYKNCVLNLNEGNMLREGIPYPNYLLRLDKDYTAIKSKYNENTRRNLRKCESEIDENVAVSEFLQLCSNYPFWHNVYGRIAQNIIQEANNKGHGKVVGIRGKNGLLMSAVSLLYDEKRIIYHIAGSTDEGKTKGAMFMLVDAIIREFAGSGKVLDFEGSKVDGVTRFYMGFGAEKVHYYGFQKGLIPFVYNLIK